MPDLREPARTPSAAVRRYRKYLQKSLACLSPAIWYVAPRLRGKEHQKSLVLSEDPIRLKRPGGTTLLLSAGHHFHIEKDSRHPGEFKVRTDGYFYRVRHSDDSIGELISWHWHPGAPMKDPHVHITGLHGLHVPSGRIAFEEVVWMLVQDLGISARRSDWRDVLTECLARFRAYRTWH
jgi:hypothetical protein